MCVCVCVYIHIYPVNFPCDYSISHIEDGLGGLECMYMCIHTHKYIQHKYVQTRERELFSLVVQVLIQSNLYTACILRSTFFCRGAQDATKKQHEGKILKNK